MDYKIEYDANGKICEILYKVDGKEIPLFEKNGKKREEDLYEYAKKINEEQENKSVAIFLGMGSCEAIKKYSEDEKTVCIVVDDTGLINEIGIQKENIYYIESVKKNVIEEYIKNIMDKEKKDSIFSVVHPFYARNYKEKYRELQLYINTFDIKNKSIHKSKKEVRILFVGSSCFIRNEFIKAAEKEGIKHSSIILPNELKVKEYKKILLEEYNRIRPNFIVTTNHTAFDRSNIFAQIIEALSLPVASYFMDNPYLDIEKQSENTRKYTSVFTYDADTIEYIKSCSFENVYYLPLGTDTERFIPGNNPKNTGIQKNILGFLGSSHAEQIAKHKKYGYPAILQEKAQEIALYYEESEEHLPNIVMKKKFLECYDVYRTLDMHVMREYEQYIIYLATNRKRKNAIIAASILPITVAGDSGWNIFQGNRNIRLMKGLPYSQAHYFYRQMEILLNSVCTQMKNAVNQRIFDAPAAGTFVLTEYTKQIESVFEVGKEIICYRNLEELQEYLRYYHKNENARKEIIQRGRERILKEHDYRHRLRKIIEKMQEVCGV